MDELDILTANYATYQDAEAADYFRHGWLPAIIPRSSRKIVEIYNIDTNEVCATFEIDPSESGVFASTLDRERFKTYPHPALPRPNFLRGRCPFGNREIAGATAFVRRSASGANTSEFFAVRKDEAAVYYWASNVDPAA